MARFISPTCPFMHGCIDFYQSMLHAEIDAIRIKGVATEDNTFDPDSLDVCGRPAITGRVGEVRAVVRQDDVDPVRNSFDEVTEQVVCDPERGLAVKLNERAQGPHILKALGRAWTWRRKLKSGEATTVLDIAKSGKVTDRFLKNITSEASMD